MTLKNLYLTGPKRTFTIDFVNGKPTGLGKFETTSLVTISSPVDNLPYGPVSRLEVVNIAGIDQALNKLNGFLSCFDRKFKFSWAQRSCAALLHGGHGTGKTFILNKIIATGWGKVIRIKNDIKPPTIRTIFKDAMLSQPCIIVIEELEKIVSKEDATSQTIAEALGEELDALSQNNDGRSLPRVLVIATTLDAGSIPLSLKKRGRFRTEISLPIPDAAARKAILKSIAPPVDPRSRDEVLDKLGDRTHAYTAEDLVCLLDTACEIAEERLEASDSEILEQECFLSQDDIDQSLLLVRPTAMHDITLQPPSVRWEDIGGQDSVKNALRHAVETPLRVSIQAGNNSAYANIHPVSRAREEIGWICHERTSPLRSPRLLQNTQCSSHGHRDRLQLLCGQGCRIAQYVRWRIRTGNTRYFCQGKSSKPKHYLLR
jgi:AAA family ATPase